RSHEGSEYWIRGVFREVDAPSRLVFTWAWEDDDGKPGHETLVAVTLEEFNGRTRFCFHQAAFESVESRDSHNGGWTECFDRLEAYLAKQAAARA
ncbi:MAG TPA: SRPBCC domain-containing protein, partial [Gammaproteobacteria bacterium]